MKDLCMIIMFIICIILFISTIIWKSKYESLYKNYEESHNNYLTAIKMLQLFDKELKEAIELEKVKVKGVNVDEKSN